MKKFVLSFVILVLLAYAATWIFIPQQLKISSPVLYNANGPAVANFLVADSNWKKWWPGNNSQQPDGKTRFRLMDHNYTIKKIQYSAFEIDVEKDNVHYPAFMKIVPVNSDSTAIELSTEVKTGMNPFNRIKKYFNAKKLKENFDSILSSLMLYTKETKNIYGFSIRNEIVTIQFLLSTSKIVDHYPTTEDIYSLIEKLRSHLNAVGGKEEFVPMLNIEKSDNITYLVRVGLPVNKKVPVTNDILLKQMLKGGNILVAEVTGGQKNIEYAVKQMEKYISDYQLNIIALPFQSLETDRRKVTDSTKWVTKIFYPIV